MLPLKVSNIGQAFQPEDSKNTNLIWIKCTSSTHAQIALFGLYGLCILQLFLATQMLLIQHYTSLLYTFCVSPSTHLCFVMCMKFKFIAQKFTCPEYVNIAFSTLKNVLQIRKLQNRLQISQKRLIFNQETQSVSHYHQVKHPVSEHEGHFQ